ncbi:hypothetical protein DFH07DRAFT_969870 [Mycena maculata]|uniref:Uncharacterized protein n=1 Tax=Mycena maculata TaxID=230809 RepID=A0AAD7HU84_9AGAR|nr:hypothetical protein DFH07DRAFT_969870 [Mycena maculata]
MVALLTASVVSVCALRKVPFKPDIVLPYLQQLTAHDDQQKRAGERGGEGSGPGDHSGPGDDDSNSQDGEGDSRDGDGRDDDERPHRKRSLTDRLSDPDDEDDDGPSRPKRPRVNASGGIAVGPAAPSNNSGTKVKPPAGGKPHKRAERVQLPPRLHRLQWKWTPCLGVPRQGTPLDLGLPLGADEEDDPQAATSFLPKYMRGMAWKHDQSVSYSRTAHYTEIDEPLPRPPAYELQNTAALRTIHENPDLFHNSRVIKDDRLESLLTRHPNPSFVQSVLAGLRDGFWPWMNTHHDDGYPETWDNSWAPPASVRERDFINSQRDIEVEKGRFSHTFGPDLLLGMYSTPILAVPKPHSDDLRLVSHQSCGPFATYRPQNNMLYRLCTPMV